MKRINVFWGILIITMFGGAGCGSAGKDMSLASFDSGTEAETADLAYDIESYQDRMAKSGYEKEFLSEYKEQYQSDIEAVLNTGYDNMDFEGCVFAELPKTESLSLMKAQKNDISVEQSWNAIADWLKSIEKYDSVDMETEVMTANSDFWNENEEDGVFYEHISEMDSGDCAYINRQDCYIMILDGGIFGMSTGEITDYLGLGTEAGYDSLGINSEDVLETGYLSEMGDKVYPLIDGEMSVNDGAELVKEYFMSGTPLPPEAGVTIDVPEVSVFRLSDVYGYDFTVRRAYHDVPFAYMTTGRFDAYGGCLPGADIKFALVTSGKGIAAFCGEPESEELFPLVTDGKIIGLKQALDNTSNELASMIKVQAETVGLVYYPMTFENSDDPGERIVFPCWEIRGYNKAKGEEIYIYTDVFTGDVYYYTR